MRQIRIKETKNTLHYTRIGRGRAVLTRQICLLGLLTLTGCTLLALETTALGRIPLPFLGMGRAAPSLGLLFCMAAGFLHDERVGGGFGLLLGYLADCMDYSREGSGVMLLPLIWFLFGFVSGMVGRHRLAHNLPSFLVLAAAGGGVEALLTVTVTALQAGAFPPLAWIRHAVLPVWILTVLAAPVVYGLLKGEENALRRTA